MTGETIHKHDVIIIGSGIAGLQAALTIAPHHDVAVITKVYPTRSHSSAAQGGIAASLGNVDEDNWEWHFYDTVKGADYLCDQDAVEILVKEAPGVIYELEHLGVPFSRTPDGRIMQRSFGGHSKHFGKEPANRACYAEDRTGHALLHTLWEQCIKAGIKVYNEFYALSLAMNNNSCTGITAWDIINGGIQLFNSKVTVLATGGYARAFKICTNSFAGTGDGLSLVLQSGLCLEDMEFVQFHPTGLYKQGILITEGVRGEGGHLINNEGKRFMENYSPDLMELAPRDIVARSIQTEINQGRGIDGKDFIYLDLKHLGKDTINHKLPQIRDISINFINVDPRKEPIPVQPSAHYSMGGIPTTIWGEVLADGVHRQVNGLYAAGECACVSVHGANRLGCNSTLEAALFGKRVGKQVNQYLRNNIPFQDIPGTAMESTQNKINTLFAADGEYRIADLREELQEIMMADCGIFRNEEGLSRALDKIKELQEKYTYIKLEDKSKRYNLDLMEALELNHLLDFSEVIVEAARARTESRGAHTRTDYPERNDSDMLKHSLGFRKKGDLKIKYKPVVITRFKPEDRKY